MLQLFRYKHIAICIVGLNVVRVGLSVKLPNLTARPGHETPGPE